MPRRYYLLLLVLLPSLAVAQSTAERIGALVQQYHDLGQINGAVLVAENGEVIYEEGVGEADMTFDVSNTPDTRFLIGSVTKNFTVALILQLMEEGRLDVQAPISTYLPDYPAEVGDRVTVHHLLTHASGIPSYTGLAEFRTMIVANPQTPESLIGYVEDRELEFEPGAEFRYNNSGYVLLGMIVEAVTGKPWAEVLEERILDPLGMETAGVYDSREIVPDLADGYTNTPAGYVHAAPWNMTAAYAAGAMYARPHDLYVWDRALADERVFDEAATYDLFYGPHLDGYGYGWFVKEEEIGGESVRIIEHGGGLDGFITGFRRLPDDGHLIVVTDNTMGEVNALVDGITHLLYGEAAPAPVPSIATAIRPVVETQGYEVARAEYQRLKEEQPDAYDFGEGELNTLGYVYLRDGDVETAIDVFRLNAEAYPEAFNTYDSLGEGYMAAGDTAQAVANYQKSLELNPANANARQMLREMGVEVGEEAETVELSPEVLERYVGTYQLQPGFNIVITREGDRLFGQGTNQPQFELFAQSENRFFLKAVNAQVEFHDYEDGEADTFTLFQNGEHTLTRVES
jgi:CubicO group peptidase (beta-lactamase class C family)